MKEQIHEKDLLIPALKVVNNNPGITTSELIKALEEEVELSPYDREILPGRNDSRFSQKVRNLSGSHVSTNEFGTYVTVTKNGQVNSFRLNNRGKNAIASFNKKESIEIINDEHYQKEIEEADAYSKKDLQNANNRRPEMSNRLRLRYKTDPKIAKTVLKQKDYKCEYALLCGKEHKTFNTKNNVEYKEAHHLIPIKAQRNFAKNIDRSENIVSLCPNCHRAIHYACKEDKVKILKKLYDARIEQLNKAEINITLEDLYNKYYV